MSQKNVKLKVDFFSKMMALKEPTSDHSVRKHVLKSFSAGVRERISFYFIGE